jgi:hypothetical protein
MPPPSAPPILLYVDRRRWVSVLAVIAVVALAIGIPVLWFTSVPRTETADGDVVQVDTAARTIVLHDLGGANALRGHDVLIRLPDNGRITVQAGDHVRVRMSERTHRARSLTIER